MKFKVKDNHGKEHISKEYTWSREFGIPNEYGILEDMEDVFPCQCIPNESNSYCDCPSNFDEGEVISVYE